MLTQCQAKLACVISCVYVLIRELGGTVTLTMTMFLETYRISPLPGAAAELTVPLSFQDIIWIHYHPIRRLLFYDYPCSNSHFMETIVPKLKESLSLTLQNYLPVAGNLLIPSDTENTPVIRYVSGDSVSLVIAESSNDFDELVGNHARDADQFYDLLPQMPPVIDDSGYKIVPVLALQVTLFPGRGICLGFANLHALGDANSILNFMTAWASINKLNGDDYFAGESLPIFDRSVIKDAVQIGGVIWKKIWGKIPFEASSFPVPTNRVRATFILTQNDITELKKMVLGKKPSVVKVSSFVVTTSYVWNCLMKSGQEEVDDDETEIFLFPVDARGRVDPPVPCNYFGNCLGYGKVGIGHKKMAGEEGFVSAAVAIAEEIKKKVNKKNEVFKGAENWGGVDGNRVTGVSGSAKFDLPKVDFGWGMARKLEVVSIDGEEYSMSICKSRDFEGGLEIGISLPPETMAAFASIFARGLSF
ncbi:hypothetical protein ACS0TY_020928 [Phlomoides rotata]